MLQKSRRRTYGVGAEYLAMPTLRMAEAQASVGGAVYYYNLRYSIPSRARSVIDAGLRARCAMTARRVGSERARNTRLI